MNDNGPLDELPFPSQLTARVVDPVSRAIHGYDPERDLARHYRFTDSAFLALTGELPGDAASGGLDLALTFLAPTSVAEAPGHAAVLARVCAADLGATLAVASTALAEQARHVVESHAPWIAWLSESGGQAPAGFDAIDERERESVATLRGRIAAVGVEVPKLSDTTSRMASILAVLHACGLRKPEHMAVLLVMARLPCVMAEAMAVPLASFQGYPMHLPPFHWEQP